MAEGLQPNLRGDDDLAHDIQTIIVKYPPTNADRHHIHIRVEQGQAFLSGYVQTPIHRRYLHDKVAVLPGIHGVHLETLYDDESMRLEIGRIVPEGVQVNVRYGVVVLSGGGTSASISTDIIAQRVAAVAGVTRVISMMQPS